MEHKNILVVATEGDNTRFLYHALQNKFGVKKVIIERPISKQILLKRRIVNLGVVKVMGQVLFLIIVVPILKFRSKERISEIVSLFDLKREPIPEDKILYIDSVNSPHGIQIIQDQEGDLVIINGTRIISKKTLESVRAKWVNIHAGITPKYRGVHGAYWALYNGEPELCGTSIHFVDKGIDTGEVIDQCLIKVTKRDNFCTYPYLQYAEGLKRLLTITSDLLKNELKTKSPLTTTSKLWYHPTLGEYLYGSLLKKVK